ncbi:peptidoglycan-binding protein [Patescibacteria group bacterium]|nr:peptidoglycan-binding protein [Patescibacteria group bacterium]
MNMTLHKLARYFALGNFAFAAAIFLSMAVLLQSPEKIFAQSTTQSSGCVAPSFYSFKVPTAYINSPWSLPMLSAMDGPYTPTVTAQGLPPGIELQDQRTAVASSSSTMLHTWILSGTPTQAGTYTITVTAQNSCGGGSTVVTLPVNNGVTSSTVCPTGTVGTYPNCASVPSTTAFDKESLVVSTSSPTVTGSSNTPKVSLVVAKNNQTVYTSPLSSVLNGRWSITIPKISTGSYGLSLYDANNLLLIVGNLIAAIPSDAASTNSTPTSQVPVTLTPVSTTGGGTVSTSACIPFQNTMRLGGRGTEVAALQDVLISKGLLPAGSATGYFGPLTRAAVQQLQTNAGIVSSGDENSTGFGLVGARTRALLGCQNAIPMTPQSGTNTSPAQSYTPVTSLPACPQVPRPVCTNGTLIFLGTDENRCSLGYACQTAQTNRPDGYVCPVVNTPSCQYGNLVSLGTDYYGCSLGSYCQKPSCGYTQQITSCPAGQTLVSGTDQYGCTNVSYCSGAPASTTTTPTIDKPAGCRAYYPAACPAGQHNQILYSYRDLNNCPVESFTCVPD